MGATMMEMHKVCSCWRTFGGSAFSIFCCLPIKLMLFLLFHVLPQVASAVFVGLYMGCACACVCMGPVLFRKWWG